MGSDIKDKFAFTLRELMQTTPFSRITVSDICLKAGYSRRSFYNHFRDKEELINWVFYDWMIRSEIKDFTGDSWDAVKIFLQFFAMDRRFFSNALKDMRQNSFGQYFSDVLFEFTYSAAAKAFRRKGISETRISFIIGALVEDTRLAIVSWLDEGEGQPDSDELFDFLTNAADVFCCMFCLRRARKLGADPCEYVADLLGDSFLPGSMQEKLTIPKPDEMSVKRTVFEKTMNR